MSTSTVSSIALLAVLLATASCTAGPRQNMAAGTPGEPAAQTYPNQADTNVAFTRDMRPVDFANGTWGTQNVTPSADLLLVRQTDLTGQRMYDSNNLPVGTIEYLLVDSTQQRARYAVVSIYGSPDTYMAVPLSAVRVSPTLVQVDTPMAQLNRVPKYSLAGLQQRYASASGMSPAIYAGPSTYYGSQPPSYGYGSPVQSTVPGGTTVSVPAGSTATITSPSGVMTTVGGPFVATAPMTEAVNLSVRSDLVGRPVLNSAGQQLGNVEYVGVVPSTGEVRYVVVGGDVFGTGNRIFVPIYQTHMSGGRVVLDAPDATLMQAQRFQRSDLQQFYIVN